MASAATTTASPITIPGNSTDQGYLSVTTTSGSTTAFTIMTNVGQARGSTTYDVLQDSVSIVE
jgi:hypothetical protein